MGKTDEGYPTVVVQRVSRTFRVPSLEAANGQGRLPQVMTRLGWRPKVTLEALSDVSLTARSGEAIGVIGRNGSGKSTLLRLIAGLDVPTSGDVTTTSQPILLGVNAALQPELSGMANARLGLLAMGFSLEELTVAIPKVADQADLGRAIHRPMRTYSSGMGARLRFAIATATEPEILLIDEALATGDDASRERAERRMEEIRAGAGTVFLVTHSGKIVEETCTRAIWLNDGIVVHDGPAVPTARAYRWWAWNVAKGRMRIAERLLASALRGHPVTDKSPGRNPAARARRRATAPAGGKARRS